MLMGVRGDEKCVTTGFQLPLIIGPHSYNTADKYSTNSSTIKKFCKRFFASIEPCLFRKKTYIK